MKIIQTFWTGPSSSPLNNIESLDMKGGWLSSEYHWMSWSLSCLQLRKFYDDVELITDERGKEILIDILNLPYTKVSTTLEGTLSAYPKELWSLAKIFSYSSQNSPFLHLDGDVFVWHPFDEHIINAPLVSQNKEANIFYYRDMLRDMEKYFTYIHPSLKSLYPLPSTIFASNTGIFGGHDLAFIKEYCNAAFELVDKNHELPKYVHNPQFNFLFEQCLLYYMALSKERDITYVIPKIVDTPVYEDYVRFMDVPFAQMIHPVGGYKKMLFICDHLAKRLRKEYPEYYYNIINIYLHKNLPVINQVYEKATATPEIYFLNDQIFYESKDNTETIKVNNKTTIASRNGSGDFSFPRTLTALEILSNDALEFSTLLNNRTDSDLYNRLKKSAAGIATIKGKKTVLEILQLEYQISKLLENLEDPAFVQEGYLHDKKNYHEAEEVFTSDIDQILGASLRLNENAVMLDLSKKWEHDPTAEGIKFFIQKQLNEEDSLNQVMLVPNMLHLAVDEIYLDSLEMIIVNIVKDRPKEIREILIEAGEYFDSAEIKENFQNYRKLIFDTIKILLFSMILKIENKSTL
ncbi:MAG: hypothetical protein JST75_16975 [Bacteroidetes bacterium]|nr:hypothetical protein [Bacteroidota bacterium]